jgi:SWIM zinc finger
MRRTNPGPAMRHLGRLIADRTDSARLVRGHEIFEDELVTELVVTGDRIHAEIIGTRQWPYEVTLRMPRGEGGTLPTDPWKLRFDCSCPDSGDPCKHGVALTLAAADMIDRGVFPGFEQATAPDDSPSRLPLAAPPVEALPSRRTPLNPLPVPTVRPHWAEELPDRAPPTTLAAWLGSEPSPETGHIDLSGPDAIDLLLNLGPCEVPGGGPNLAASIQLLVLKLLGGA